LEFLLEIILNFLGLVVGLVIATMSYVGYKNTGSPTLFRLTIAFFAIGIGFGILATGFILDDFIFKTGDINRGISTLGVTSQVIGYWFIAFSHTIRTFFPKSRYFRSIGAIPLFLVSFNYIENIFRAISFILLVYGAIETMISYVQGRKKTTLFVGIGLSLLAFGEFIGWYSFVFPETVLYSFSIIVKIVGLIAVGIPVSKIPLRKVSFDENL